MTTADHRDAPRDTSTTGGTGRLSARRRQDGDAAFAFAYDASLFRRDDDNDDQCFSRDASRSRHGHFGVALWPLRREHRRAHQSQLRLPDRLHRPAAPCITASSATTACRFRPKRRTALENGGTVAKVDYSSGGSTDAHQLQVVKCRRQAHEVHAAHAHASPDGPDSFHDFVGNRRGRASSPARSRTSQYELYWDEARGSSSPPAQMKLRPERLPDARTFRSPQVCALLLEHARWRPGLLAVARRRGVRQPAGRRAAASIRTRSRSSSARRIWCIRPICRPQLYCLQNCPTAASLQCYFSARVERRLAVRRRARTTTSSRPRPVTRWSLQRRTPPPWLRDGT